MGPTPDVYCEKIVKGRTTQFLRKISIAQCIVSFDLKFQFGVEMVTVYVCYHYLFYFFSGTLQFCNYIIEFSETS